MDVRENFSWYFKKTRLKEEKDKKVNKMRHNSCMRIKNELQFTYSSRSSSQSNVLIFISIVRDAFVTSVTCNPPSVRPVRF